MTAIVGLSQHRWGSSKSMSLGRYFQDLLGTLVPKGPILDRAVGSLAREEALVGKPEPPPGKNLQAAWGRGQQASSSAPRGPERRPGFDLDHPQPPDACVSYSISPHWHLPLPGSRGSPCARQHYQAPSVSPVRSNQARTGRDAEPAWQGPAPALSLQHGKQGRPQCHRAVQLATHHEEACATRKVLGAGHSPAPGSDAGSDGA